ncbi:hypothetical protein GW901_00835 [Candidatus Parcubacteria bacterium]|nr:hypothetical protein [Candidatus Parcubacteria bacterium]
MLTLSFTVKGRLYRIKSSDGEDLLISLDKFLKKNRIKSKDINRIFLDTSQEKSITSKRIAQAILKALKIARE